MDHKPLPVGIDNFEKLVTRGYYFVDKTLLIRDLLDRKCDVLLFTRPRRFGKTLNMSMLQYFFEDMRDENGGKIDHAHLFDGLNIMKEGEDYLKHMGAYPVISLTLKAAKCPTYESACEQLMLQICMEYNRHGYILKHELPLADRERFEKIMNNKAVESDYRNSLQLLSRCLKTYYGRNAIILIDEYDVPLENAYAEGFYDEMVSFIRSLFEAALKTNDSLEFAVITGCLRISKESIFTGLNNLNVISILNKSYDEYFGFTDSEVKRMCEDLGIAGNYEDVKEWYDGYVFGDANVYNPWSVIMYMFDHVDYPGDDPKPYWSNTSSNSIVRKLIDMADEHVKGEIEDLIMGGSIEKQIHEDITYDEVYSSMDNLWNFMFFAGYFRKVGERTDGDDIKYLTLRIPNREVRYIFRNKIMQWFNEQVKARDLSALHSAIVSKDTDAAEEELNDILLHSISYMDANESYYHGILAGLLIGIPGYYIKSNREGGKGRSDLMLLPVSRRKEAFIFEFKKADHTRRLEEAASEAFRQIDDRAYKAEAADMGYDIISCYAIAFCGKDCTVKWRA